jgi:hypothetical protein
MVQDDADNRHEAQQIERFNSRRLAAWIGAFRQELRKRRC